MNAPRGPATARPFDPQSSRLFPLAPIWPGFAINTLWYATILWLLISGPLVLPRLIRRKRGHYIKCGYDLCGNLVHDGPECGWR